MKKYLFLIGLVVTCLIYSCGKSGNPAPDKPTPTKPIDNTKPPTDPDTGNGGTDGTGIGETTPTRTDINTAGGNGAFDKNGGLTGLQLGDANISSDFKTITDINTNTKTTLENAKSAVLDKTLGQWRASFPDYNAADTTKRPYIRVIYTDAGKHVTEYRVYIVGKDARLYRYETSIAATMDADTFIKGFATNNTQKVILAKTGN